MEGEKISWLGARKKLKRKKRKLVTSIVAYLKSDEYFFAPLFSTSPPLKPQIQKDDIPLEAGNVITRVRCVSGVYLFSLVPK